MLVILKSCFNQTDREYLEPLAYMTDKHNEYKNLGINLLGEGLYIDCLSYMQETFTNAGQFPSESLFLINYPKMPADTFSNISVVLIEDLHVYVKNLISVRLNIAISNRIKELLGVIATDGLTDDIAEQLTELKKLSNKTNTPDMQLRQNARDNYDKRSLKPLGMITGVKSLDDLIIGMDEGTVSVIAGFTGHMKTMFAVNIAYKNAYHNGYNIAYLSLETPKDMIYDQLLSRHSYDLRFPKYPYIPHQKIHRCSLSPDEYDYLFDVIEPDLFTDYQDPDGTTHKRGRVVFFDQSDFDAFSFDEISNTLEALDDKLNGSLHALIVDYAQLCKFTDGGAYAGDVNSVINSYMAYFRKLAQNFRSGKKNKKLIVILLSQINRTSYERATSKKGNGYYDLTCLADANELERGANRVFTTFTSENMKFVHEARVQLLKNRSGATLTEPETVFAFPEAYVYGDIEDSYGQTYSGGNNTAIAQYSTSIDPLAGTDDTQYSAKGLEDFFE